MPTPTVISQSLPIRVTSTQSKNQLNVPKQQFRVIEGSLRSESTTTSVTASTWVQLEKGKASRWSLLRSQVLKDMLMNRKRQILRETNIWQANTATWPMTLKVWKSGDSNLRTVKRATLNNKAIWTGKNLNHWVCRLGLTTRNSKKVITRWFLYLGRIISSSEFSRRMRSSLWVTFKNWLKLRGMKM